MGSEAEGFYRLLRGVTSCSHPLPSQPPPSHAHLSPSSPAPQQSPQESAGPEVSGPVGPATVSTPAAATPAPESDIPVQTCNPSGFNWGVPREFTSARLRAAKRAHQPHRQPFALM